MQKTTNVAAKPWTPPINTRPETPKRATPPSGGPSQGDTRNDAVAKILGDPTLLARVMTEARQRGMLTQNYMTPNTALVEDDDEVEDDLVFKGRIGAMGGALGSLQNQTAAKAHAKGQLDARKVRVSRTGAEADSVTASFDFDGDMQNNLQAAVIAALAGVAQGSGKKKDNLKDAPTVTKPARTGWKESMAALEKVAHAIQSLGQYERANLGLSKSSDPYAKLSACIAVTVDTATVYHGDNVQAPDSQANILVAALCGLDYYFGYNDYAKDHREAALWAPPGSYALAANNLHVEEDIGILAAHGKLCNWTRIYGNCTQQAMMAHAEVPMGVPWAIMEVPSIFQSAQYKRVPVRDLTETDLPTTLNLVRSKGVLEPTLSAKRMLAAALVETAMKYKSAQMLIGDERSSIRRNHVYSISHNRNGEDFTEAHDDE